MPIKIKNINHITKAEISYFSGIFDLTASGVFSTLFAKYNGSFELKSIASGFNMRKGKKTFMIHTSCFREFNGGELFSYYGLINLSSVKIYNFNGQVVKPTIKRTTNAISKNNQPIENMDSPVETLEGDKNTKLVDNNLLKLNKGKRKKNTILKRLKQTSTGATKSGTGGQSGTTSGGSGY